MSQSLPWRSVSRFSWSALKRLRRRESAARSSRRACSGLEMNHGDRPPLKRSGESGRPVVRPGPSGHQPAVDLRSDVPLPVEAAGRKWLLPRDRCGHPGGRIQEQRLGDEARRCQVQQLRVFPGRRGLLVSDREPSSVRTSHWVDWVDRGPAAPGKSRESRDHSPRFSEKLRTILWYM